MTTSAKPSQAKKTSYRPDIDGLRAVAVLAVILYHFNPAWLPGGFIGVDIFFVISGFLIIRIIMSEMAAGTFSIVNFWERRVRRIIPALAVVLAAVTVYSYYFLLLPIDLANYGRSLMAQSVFVSNWFFMQQSSYFAAPDNTIPLLHTWSLSIEEQFYLLFPLLVLLVYPYVKRKIGPVLIGLAALSFAYGVILVNVGPTGLFSIPLLPHIWGSATNSSAGFYFIASRFWELMVGGLIAVYALKIQDRWLSEIVALSGLIAIGVGAFLLNDASPFPGVAALLPVLGTGAVIIANAEQHTLARRVLSFPVLVYIGLISYSLYLWHWPILVLARYQLTPPETLGPISQVVLIVAIFVVSFLTYRFVETPIRKKLILAKRRDLFLAAFISMSILFATGFVFAANDGFPSRLLPQARPIAAAMGDLDPRMQDCFSKSVSDEPCLLGLQDPSHIDFVLWGDSHAGAAISAFDAFGRQTNQTGIFFGAAACPPFLTDKPITNNHNCIDEKKNFIAYMQKNPPKKLYMISEWEQTYRYTDGSGDLSTSASLLAETLAQLPKETKISIFLRLPSAPDGLFRSYFFRKENGENIAITLTGQTSMASLNIGIEQAASLFDNVHLINPLDVFCKGEYCNVETDQGFYYADDTHLSVYGAMQIYLPLLLNEEQVSK